MLSVLLVLLQIASYAQNERKLTDYAHEAQIAVIKDEIVVSMDGKSPQTFKLTKKLNALVFANEEDKTKFLYLLQLSDNHIIDLCQQYQVSKKDLANKLLQRSVELKGLKLINASLVNTSTASDSTLETLQVNTHEELSSSITNNQTETIKSNTIPIAIGALLVGLMLGILLAKWFKNLNLIKKDKPISQTENSTAPEKINKQEKLELTEAKQALSNLQNEHDLLTKNYEKLYDLYEDRINFDKHYFTSVNEKLITPFWNAAAQKNEDKLIEACLKSMAHYTALTRLRLEIDQSFDKSNIDEILSKQSSQQFKVINAQTNLDSIPDNILTIIAALKKNKIDGLGQTNFQGYTMNNLNS